MSTTTGWRLHTVSDATDAENAFGEIETDIEIRTENGDIGFDSRPWSMGSDYSGPRRGWSVCATIADLHEYMAGRGPDTDDTVMIKIEGELSEDEDHDAGRPGGPYLLIPSRVLRVRTIDPADWADDDDE